MEFCTPPIPGETHKYYGDAHNNYIRLPQFNPVPIIPAIPKMKKKTTEQKTLHDLAAVGNLILLKQILLLLPDPLKAVNEAQSSTGFTPLHYAAARGHLKIVECLVDEYSVSVDARDKEGETALHKAAYNGRYHIVNYLVSKNANIHQKDKDGWTALHNACARGCLPIVRLLINHGARVDVRSKMGHTPLINAASKGYISIVEYLLDEAHANPLLKNHIGEAAYDASAASREAYICEILEKAGKKWWHTQQMEGTNNNNNNPSSTRNSQYDVLDYHVTVMVVLHENQRATSLLGLSRPQFNASYLTKQDVRGPWSLHPSGTPSSKDQVEPPRQKNDTGRANWFWITDWQIDLSDPRIDPTSGWQYARSFEENDEAWTPVAPTGGNGWVRRRRWVRVMNRQMDFASNHRHLGNNGYDLNISQDDYLATAEDMVQSFPMDISDLNDDDSNRTVGQRIQALTKELRAYEESVQLLLAGVKDDLNQYRKERANNLIKIHSTKIDKLNGQIATLAPQLATPISPAPLEHNAELARELGFISNDYQNNRSDHDDNDRYPNKANGNDFDANPWTRDTIGSDRTSFQPRSLQRLDDGDNNSTSGSSLMHQVEFDNNNNNNNNSSPYEAGSVRGFEWESDINAKDCRRCNRRFGLLNRRHHCRRCGLIVCDRCSASRAYLPASQILQNPNGPLEPSHVLESHHQRICDKCYADLGINA